jgi:KUP system potassium uptake protein
LSISQLEFLGDVRGCADLWRWLAPAVSVLSALEVLDIVTSTFHPYILPAAVAVLIALFAIQPLGMARIGRGFGPIMTLWFAVMAVLRLWGIAQHPTVLFAYS